ncbi:MULTISPECIES: aldehyde dehydrogenase family protein [Burkholderia cepacia complex]|uniref:aldehyde dehydrogenase family protein n=1 Tax=Burkholderia cepacia complex TaxID=87882 RepID=UPI000757ADA4|nr:MULTISPECIES: aldehyde dehydrogenase family protein [Burkholderia cepacia complex]KUZ34877.1 aldehyde dehydrogenase [Burkholderia territorii]KUZ59688.1 aldehyde dehydrogenase [Burkholderia territorii]KVC15896.1 aldehyde dehydrogenase [Burkholderia diffusa]
MRSYDKIYIDGQWVEPTVSETWTLINPATEQPFATVALGGTEDVERAVRAARAAFPSFSATTKEARLALLARIIERFSAREAELAAAVTEELGTPVSQKIHTTAALASFKQAVATLRDYAFETRLDGNLVRREPIGVCALITAWNWPIQLIATKLAYALAAGCTTILKPSEFTPVSAILLTEILDEAGVPKGVFNLVNGNGPVVGNALSRHMDVDLVSFTGSTRAGILVAEAAAPSVKRVCQELGGKSANIVLDDADLRAAAEWNITRAFANSGQSCHAPTRILVHERQRDTFLEMLRVEAGKVRVGNPLDESVTMGPVVNRSQYERIQNYIRIGLEEGATLVTGGPGLPAGLSSGYFIKPTVFADVKPEMRIAQEEIFGPVLVVMTYSSDDEAIEIANGTEYGLGGYVFSASKERGRAIGSRIRAGRVFFNGVASNPAAPMGGYKRSGNGREMGVFGIEEYLEVKAMLGFDA